MSKFKTGQRWLSESEPELGLATVVTAGEGRVQVLFPATGETRTYADDNAPLRRVQFRVGDTIKSHDGRELKVTEVRDHDGLLIYFSDDGELPEALLCDSISLHGPEDRLFAGRFDAAEDFDLRRRTLELQSHRRRSPVRGFLGGRIDLIPHQLYIAQEVANRHAPRVLLSDEVGLGKTIEACLILHRLLLTHRASRVLVLVPDSLVHQWFVEMLRKFNVWLNIFDEERCAAIEGSQPGENPFLDDQLVLASIDFLKDSPQRAAQAVATDWDVLVVDEAHHLEWSPDAPSAGYVLVEQLSRRAEGLLLLTATPEQLGLESHFARLRLLDPDRYRDLESFRSGAGDYQATADLVEKLLAGRKPTRKESLAISQLLKHDSTIGRRLEALATGDANARREVLDNLLDLHGPGRVLFRNTRAAMQNFPKRRVHLAPLTAVDDHAGWVDRVSTEFAIDAGDATLDVTLDLAKDPRLLWLVDLLGADGPGKVLLICRSLEKAEAIDEALRRHLTLKSAVFHEGLTLIQRDRNAAWFAEEDGARLLICSEIGSEGRNFQFAHHLVLFDLPLNPELLEQRIGRLDRIGQTEDIRIHVPFLTGSPQEVLARWYHDGLDAFESNLEGGSDLLKQFGRQVHDFALEYAVAEPQEAQRELTALLKESAAARKEIRRRLEQGRDRLLEMNSYRPAVAQEVIDAIGAEDGSPLLADYLLDVFEHFGVQVEELAPRTWQLGAQGLTTDAFPSLPAEGMIGTCERRRAVGREDVGFLTWDHPMVTGAMDLLLGSEKGNCAFAVLPTANERTLLLEAIYVLEAVARPSLHADRFLPATPVRVVLNHKPADVTPQFPSAALAGALKKGVPYKLLDNADIMRGILPKMLKAAETAAGKHAKQLVTEGLTAMNQLLGHELQRLKTLRQVNENIRPEEIELAATQQRDLTAAIETARLRLDSVRLIWKGPPEVLG